MQSSLRGALIRVAHEDISIRAYVLPLVTTKLASQNRDLERQVIRLAYVRPELRDKLLPLVSPSLIKKAAEGEGSSSAMSLIKFYKEKFGNKPTPVKGVKGNPIKLDTVMEYASNKGHALYKESVAYLKKLSEEMKKQETRDKIKKTTKDVSKKALKGAFDLGKGAIKAGMRGLGSVLEASGEGIMDRYGPVDGAMELGGSVMKAGFGKAMEALKDDSGNFESVPSRRNKNIQDLDTGEVYRQTVERQKSFGARVANGAKRVAKAGAIVGATAVGGVAAAGVGASVGAGMKVLGGVTKLAGKGLKRLGKKASEGYNPEEMEEALAEFFTMPDDLRKKMEEEAIDDDGVFDQDKFDGMLEAHFKQAEEEFDAQVDKFIEAHGGSKEEIEEAKEDAKDKVKSETSEAFISKTALVRTAYENPQYRRQLVELIQQGMPRYPMSQVRSVLQG